MNVYYKTAWLSPLGEITLTCDEKALIHLSLPGQKPFPNPCAGENHPILEQAKDWLRRYFAGEAPAPGELPLKPMGTPFRELIWQLLLRIPYGQTASYGALAKQAAEILEKPRMSAQAVGQAVGANPIPIIIPCHRVLGSDGSLTGYAGGVRYKTALLELESPEP